MLPIFQYMGYDDLKEDHLSGASEIFTQAASQWLNDIQSLQPSSVNEGIQLLRQRGLSPSTNSREWHRCSLW